MPSIPNPVVLFDAVGTLIYPFPRADQVYHSIGADFGCQLSHEEIKVRFASAFQQHFALADHLYNVPSSEEIERTKWNQVVRQVFGESYSDELFANLWSYFAEPNHWRCYDDASRIVSDLLEQGIQVGVASNFDQRLKPILRNYFQCFAPNRVYCSSEVGFAKPDVRFFKEIECALERELGRARILMIGDHWKLDVDAPRRAGWITIWKNQDVLPPLPEIEHYFFRSK